MPPWRNVAPGTFSEKSRLCCSYRSGSGASPSYSTNALTMPGLLSSRSGERIASRMTFEKGGPMGGQLVHFEIAASDDGRAMDFYKSVLGWEFQDSGMPGVSYNMTEAGGQP